MKKYKLPDMSTFSRAVCTYILGGNSYNFRFVWCDSFFLMDMFLTKSEEAEDILTGIPLILGFDFLNRVSKPDIINGKLYLINKAGKEESPSPENLSSDFEFVYYEDDESI